MNPTTGTFVSEDSYAGRMHEPVTLHKYLYAHANPVKYTDPSGYMADTMAAVAIQGELSAGTVEVSILMSIWMLLKLNDIIKSSEAVRFADFYQSDAKTNPEGTTDDARDGDDTVSSDETQGEDIVDDYDDSYDDYYDADEDYKRPKKGKEFRGGKKKDRDKWYGYDDKDFQKWWERIGKKEWKTDIENSEMAKTIYEYWKSIGKPNANGGKWK